MIGTIRRAPTGDALAAARRLAAWFAFGAALALALPPAPAAASPEGAAVTATGTITGVKASERTITVKLAEGGGEARFVWDSDTRITGVLTPGARVTIRYVADGGRNRALQITVSRA